MQQVSGVNVSKCAFMSKDDFMSIQFDCRLYTFIIIFYILQGSVATYVRYDGKHDNIFIENFLLNLMVKDI